MNHQPLTDIEIHRLLSDALALLPPDMDTPRARLMLAAIMGQESDFRHRRQIVGGRPIGPATGLWQFERGGGCVGVLTHGASRYWMFKVCELRGVKPTSASLWRALQTDDVLACVSARLLLFTDPRRLPDVEDVDGAWRYYLRNWRPGKPHRDRWPACHARGRDVLIWSGA